VTFDSTIAALDTYLNGSGPFNGLGLGTLETYYNWPLPKSTSDIVGPLESGSRLTQTMQVKRRLSVLWREEPHRRPELALWIVTDWGGVRGNRPARLKEHLVTAHMDEPVTPFQGVSSYSKILAIRDPDRFAILDARVVVALNALQFIAAKGDGLAFPYIQGRNNITGNQFKKRGFACLPEYSVQSLVERQGWQRVKRDDAYMSYLSMLHRWLALSTTETDLMRVEMALFSQAEKLAKLVAPDLAHN